MQDGSHDLTGVGIVSKGNRLCVSRGIVNQTAELDKSVGLVCYDISRFGELPARWYHPSLQGLISDGHSADGPENTLEGEYKADYEDKNGNAFDPLRKTIEKVREEYRFSWWDSTKFNYVGVGQSLENELFAAWGPPGSIIQFAQYELDEQNQTLIGSWIDYGRNMNGSEKFRRKSSN